MQNYIWPAAEISGAVVVSGTVTAKIEDSAGNALTSTGGALDVNLKSSSITLPISAASLPLPAGAATSMNQSTIIADLLALSAQLPATLGQKASAASLAVVIASDQSAVPVTVSGSIPAVIAGKSQINQIRNDYTVTPVTTGAYVQLIASTSAASNEHYIFDSSGQTLIFAVGASGLEVPQYYIVPGGNAEVPLYIPAGSRIAIKAVSGTASVGEIDINLFS